jgi:hypothetical protein
MVDRQKEGNASDHGNQPSFSHLETSTEKSEYFEQANERF